MVWLRNLVIILVGMILGLICSFYIVEKYGACPKQVKCNINKLIHLESPTPTVTVTPTPDLHDNAADVTDIYEKSAPQIPILMYHHIKNNTDPTNKIEVGLDVSPAMFGRQIQLLKALGYKSINMKDLTKNTDYKIRYVALTFDDGYVDIYTEAWPILKKYGMTGTIFLITDDIGKPGYLNKDQIDEMIKGGFEIGSHTITHPNLENANYANAKMQIDNSKKYIEDLFSYDVNSFCYPSGKYNDQVVKLVQGAGYTNATTTNEGFVIMKSDSYRLNRIRVRGNGSFNDFAAKIFRN